jgi:hypothetical protein
LDAGNEVDVTDGPNGREKRCSIFEAAAYSGFGLSTCGLVGCI